MSEEEVDLLLSGLEDNQGQINYEGTKLILLGSYQGSDNHCTR